MNLLKKLQENSTGAELPEEILADVYGLGALITDLEDRLNVYGKIVSLLSSAHIVAADAEFLSEEQKDYLAQHGVLRGMSYPLMSIWNIVNGPLCDLSKSILKSEAMIEIVKQTISEEDGIDGRISGPLLTMTYNNPERIESTLEAVAYTVTIAASIVGSCEKLVEKAKELVIEICRRDSPKEDADRMASIIVSIHCVAARLHSSLQPLVRYYLEQSELDKETGKVSFAVASFKHGLSYGVEL